MSKGFTLPEMLVTLTIVGIVLGMASPSLSSFIARQQVDAALNEYVGQFYHARMTALRTGSRVELRLEDPGGCGTPPAGARYVGRRFSTWLMRTGDRIGTAVVDGPPSVCISMNNSTRLVIDSRGFIAPFGARTVWANRGAVADSLTISSLGRVLRRY